ncbi:DUF937 domain-containing protein [Aerolutibacter ruishenii]|uniref:Uncharacterized protein DUF937 n=1 Tax=Aerolutibacter ruishenii TaxID=686800 RepID=A0A562LI29_9GAMM|nr:DUF937 domain-containing protein [Lysobacter ruishenii]TWI07255.1 uncharacterized protein DUF937 [Lysobacter ruishenii]
MSASLANDLLSQLQGQPLQQISQQLGLPREQASGAVAAALPLLMGALGKNASQPAGAESLFGALQRDHATPGDLGGLLGSVLGGGGQGEQILGHIFGARQQGATQGLGAATGLQGDQANMLLKVLAPIVMAYLGKRMFGQGQAAASTPQGLGDILGQEQQQIRQQGGVGGGLLGAVLDQDGDGQLGLGDLLKLGGGMLGGKR